jgi:haloalkane dehalogenase
MVVVGTPDERFEELLGYEYEPQYVSVGESEIAYVDVGTGDETFLCLHGEPTWGPRSLLCRIAESPDNDTIDG